MEGTDIDAILEVRRATTRRVTAAGGITTQEEIDALHAHDVDAVVGMAVYTGSSPWSAADPAGRSLPAAMRACAMPDDGAQRLI